MKKKVLKELEQLANSLPVLFFDKVETIRERGADIIKRHKESEDADKKFFDKKGKPFIPEEIYITRKVVQEKVNHLAQLKKHYNNGGWNAVGKYSIDVWKLNREIIDKKAAPKVEAAVAENPAAEKSIEPILITDGLEGKSLLAEIESQPAILLDPHHVAGFKPENNQ